MANIKDIFNKFRNRGEKTSRGNMPEETQNQAEDIINEAEKAAAETATGTQEGVENAANAAEQPSEATAEEAPAEQPTESAEDILKAELAAAQDRNLRLMAEFDNFRRRTAQEQIALIETANGKLLEKLSEVLDNFERAFAAENKAKDLETFEKGMQMIHDQFAKVLTDAGLVQLDPTGKEFDPNYHEALMNQPSETVPEGHVVMTFQKGYMVKEKLLKTAKVIVSSGNP